MLCAKIKGSVDAVSESDVFDFGAEVERRWYASHGTRCGTRCGPAGAHCQHEGQWVSRNRIENTHSSSQHLTLLPPLNRSVEGLDQERRKLSLDLGTLCLLNAPTVVLVLRCVNPNPP